MYIGKRQRDYGGIEALCTFMGSSMVVNGVETCLRQLYAATTSID